MRDGSQKKEQVIEGTLDVLLLSCESKLLIGYSAALR